MPRRGKAIIPYPGDTGIVQPEFGPYGRCGTGTGVGLMRTDQASSASSLYSLSAV